MIPAANPGADYRAIKPDIDAAIARALGSGWYILGEEVKAFEREFAAWLGARHAVSCGNGTDALALVLRSLGIGPGATVVTVSHTAVATVAAIEMTGAVPVLIDIDPPFYTLDPVELEAVLAAPPPGLPPVRAVIAVHLYGQPAELDTIAQLCERHGASLIEDCSQAHGAMFGQRRVGTFGVAGAFSLYPTKNLGAFGDGGVITLDDGDRAARLASLRQYGWRQHYVSDEVGVNSRLDELQAAVLRVKLRHLDGRNHRRQLLAEQYDRALTDLGIAPPARRPGSTHVFHQYVVRCGDRDAVQAALRTQGVGSLVHYPVPVHRQPAYAGRIALGPSDCVATEQASREVLSLPIYPELSDDEAGRVAAALRCLVPPA